MRERTRGRERQYREALEYWGELGASAGNARADKRARAAVPRSPGIYGVNWERAPGMRERTRGRERQYREALEY